VGSRRGRSEGAELEGEKKRGGGVEGRNVFCCDTTMWWGGYNSFQCLGSGILYSVQCTCTLVDLLTF
jgi:hypothetical protein